MNESFVANHVLNSVIVCLPTTEGHRRFYTSHKANSNRFLAHYFIGYVYLYSSFTDSEQKQGVSYYMNVCRFIESIWCEWCNLQRSHRH